MFIFVFLLLLEYGSAEFETGTIILAGKFRYKPSENTPEKRAKDAILIVGDDGAMSADHKHITDEEFQQKLSQFDDGVPNSDAKMEFLNKFSVKATGRKKVLYLGAVSRGLIAVAGDRIIQQKLDSSIRGTLVSLTSSSSAIADDAREKLHTQLKEIPGQFKGEIVHAQIVSGKRFVRVTSMKKTFNWARKINVGIHINDFFEKKKNSGALGIGATDPKVTEWLADVFEGTERFWTTEGLKLKLRDLSNSLAGKYGKLLGKEFSGFILADYAPVDGPSGIIIDTSHASRNLVRLRRGTKQREMDNKCCGDRSDENKSIHQNPSRNCTAEEFHCTNNKCIPKAWKCDFDDDCGDGSDELKTECEPVECPMGWSRCASSYQCIPEWAFCNGQEDCKDGSDEEPARCDTSRPCSESEFRCNSGRCIPRSLVCDGTIQCEDGLDESQCTQRKCAEDMLQCDDGTCIPRHKWCDRRRDCANASDERNSEAFPNRPQCSQFEFECANSVCIPHKFMCDGDNNCGDNSDENNDQCKVAICEPPLRFRCAHSRLCVNIL